ncbi:RNA-binding S4 domain-containing protein [Brevibacterium sp. 5221]|uniref:RNA-binding S4 domain-containing protein n=1 Tax=Brevibacterium rongguiense TaxID=2695267 RepID=A0A6N9H8G5_9MICO|nr:MULTISPECIES: S4 domain-containing protein [Brevibacterium]MYM20357.1 RNA-binding S4 domain-containing protein [Brevibacterium rongguiense]WAL41260.1 S4 domain-containing protein [Brevibacterium sp. BRM-1]
MLEPDFDGARSQRIDVWLWTTRICKTRSAATAACRSGHVRIDGERVKAAAKVRIGQEVRVRRSGAERILTVQGFLPGRGSAPLAQACWIDRTPPPDPALRGAAPRRDKGAGRPTKKDRRELDRLRGRG